MQATVNPIEYLQLPKEFHPSASRAVDSIYNTVHQSDPSHDASRYTLPNDCLPIVREAQKLYQKRMSLLGVSALSSHLAVLRRKFSAGGQHDTVIVPLVAIENAQVYVGDKEGNNIKIDWSWEKPLFALKHTDFNIDDGKQVGAIIVHFPRNSTNDK
ncbi:uncharacterized protein BDCG_08847 [Blastomyces dermatitidis ER-3]|uniref:Uncharacterized protein n=1 Tax=Ajellomyces dermatitidis (strain ER-3 / ATCC MYA-2586) TaxID=559297 RepID=A0ABP2EPU3_AJEDR|nr:uncharacterized protein BDCG_08847 [Blastomyces dermatitidis ER-3]EEQ85578.1 hypothetical protein BDCG_08847 [Blastomyces dermatitidis ER-3]